MDVLLLLGLYKSCNQHWWCNQQEWLKKTCNMFWLLWPTIFFWKPEQLIWERNPAWHCHFEICLRGTPIGLGVGTQFLPVKRWNRTCLLGWTVEKTPGVLAYLMKFVAWTNALRGWDGSATCWGEAGCNPPSMGREPKVKKPGFFISQTKTYSKKVGDCISNNAIKGCRWFLTPGSLPQLLGSHSITVCLTAQRINIEKLHHSYIDYESGEKPRGESISSLQTFIAGTKIFGGSICRILPQRFQPLHVPSICGCFSNSFGWRFCQPSWGISLVSPQEKSHRILRIPSMDWYIIMIGLKNICPRKRHSNHSTPIYWYVESG